jgi:hypothetical protein
MSEDMPISKGKNVEGYIEVTEDIMYRRPVWYEEIATEDLWMDGELTRVDVISRIMTKVLDEGTWKIIRRKYDR